jgi:virginiamycin B lyase
VLITILVVVYYQYPEQAVAANHSLLEGRVTSTSGASLAGIPVRANRGNITVTVYTNGSGEYTYPDWTELKAGAYTVSVELPDYEHVARAVTLSNGRTMSLDIELTSRTPLLEDVTASEIIAALPGTNDQKHLLIQCDNCHSLQFALAVPRDQDGWKDVISRMAGSRRINRNTPNTRAYDQLQYLEPLSAYLASIRGPGSNNIPFQLRPRPTDDASTALVVTEYDIPRGGTREIILRGDRRAAWPHDILVEPDGPYAYYTDHYSYILGRLDRRTGEVTEFPYDVLEGMGRVGGMVAQAQLRAGNPGGGSHDMLWDSKGNVVFGLGNGIIHFNTQTHEFTPHLGGTNMFGMDAYDNVWYSSDEGLHQLDLNTGAVTDHTIPKYVDGVTYDMDTDDEGRSFFNMFRESGIGMYNPATERFEIISTPTHGSGPRRGDMDDEGRPWMGLYWAGRIGRLDPVSRELKEYNLIPGYQPYGPPFLSPYTVAVDDEHQIVWTNDFNSRRTFKIDIDTEESTEYFMPLPYEVRDLTVEDDAPRPTVWIPAYRPPAKMVRIELWEDRQ